MPPVKVLIVDDSSLMRGLLQKMLSAHKDIKVIGFATNGVEAIEKIKALKPDVVTLDVEMPVLDGLSSLRRIVLECPTPVVMCSSLTDVGTKATMEALSAGAVDFIAKPDGITKLEPVVDELVEKIKTAATVKVTRHRLGRFIEKGRQVKAPTPARRERITPATPEKSPRPSRVDPAIKALALPDRSLRTRLVAIGCSTGGPAALQQVIPALPQEFPVPLVIVQHIPAGFSKSLAEHLDAKSRIEVHHARDGEPLRPGCAFVVPSGFDISFRGRGNSVTIRLEKGVTPLPPGGFRPSADVMMTEAARVFGRETLGVIMTGMGRDGTKGMLAIKEQHGRTIAEAESSCVVYGMPKAAADAGAVDRVVSLPHIAQEIINML